MQRPSGARRLLIAVRVVHPFPTLANGLATAVFGLVASHGTVDLRLLRLVVTMVAIQCAIGATNDAVDVSLDARTKPGKPIVAGALSRGQAAAVAELAALVAVVVGATLGAGGWGLAMLGLICGLSYDLKLKRGRWSALPYLIAFAIYPLWVWTALGRFTPPLLWELPLALLLGGGLYLGNTAPDIATDIAAGVRGLAHMLGMRRALALCWGCYASALALAPITAHLAGFHPWPVWYGAAGAALLFSGSALVSIRTPNPAGLMRAWGLQVAGVLVLATGWLVATG